MKKVLGQTVRDLKREVNKKVLKVPGLERKVLDATSNEAWGPHGSHLADIAQASRNHTEFQMIMGVLWKRLSDTGKNWRHVYKALILLEYLVTHGSERVIDEIKEHAHQISTLSEFQYVDSSGRDQGSNVRRKSQSLVLLVNDKDRIQEIRQKASGYREKFGKPGGHLSPGGYCDSYNEEKRNGNGKDDRYGRYGDASSRDGDRSDRESESRYSRDGSVDYEHQERDGNINDQNNINGNRGAEIDGNRADDDCYSSSRGSGATHDDHSQEGRNENRRNSEKNSGDPPSYEEALSEGRSSVHSERGGDPTVPAPKQTSPPPTCSTTHSTDELETSHPTVTNGPVNHNEFDPRGSASAPAVTSNGTEVDLLGSLSEPFSNDSAKLQSSSATDYGVDVLMDSGSGVTFTTTSSSFSQPFEDPFGDGPFRAIPSTDGNPVETQNPPSFRTTMNQGLELLPAQSVGHPMDNLHNFDYGTPFGDVSYTPSAVPNDQFSPANTQIVPQGFHDQETDILAGILPPTGLPAQSFQSDNGFGGYHQQSGVMPPETSQLGDLSPNRQTAQINNNFFSQQGVRAPSKPHMDSQIATHQHNQPDGGDFFQQLGSSVPTSVAPFGQTEPTSLTHDGCIFQQPGSTVQVTSSITPGSSFGANTQHYTNGPNPQQPSLSFNSSPMVPQDQKEPVAQNYNEVVLQQPTSSVPVAPHIALPTPNAHRDNGGFVQQHGAPQVQNDQNSQNFNNAFFHQQYTSTTPGTHHMAPEFSYASTSQQSGGNFIQQPSSSLGYPHFNTQQPGSPQIAPQGQKEQNPQNHNSDFLHQLSASSFSSSFSATSHVGPVSSYAPNALHNTGSFLQQPASLGNLPMNNPSSMHIAPQGLKEQNPQNYSSGFAHQQSASTATGAPHMVPGYSYPSNGQQNNGGFFQQPGLSLGNPPMNPQGQIDSAAQNCTGGFLQHKQESHVAGQNSGGNFHPSPGSAQFSPRRVDTAPNQNRNGPGGIVTQGGPANHNTSQPSMSTAAGPLALIPQPTKDKFETKSTVWADTLSRGLVNLSISGSKTNPLADIGIDFDAINRKEKRMEKPAATPAVSTVTMGRAMGSGSGIGRAGATALRPSGSPMMNSGINMGIGAGPGLGRGSGMPGYGGMNQQPMGGFAGMSQQQPVGGTGVMNQQPMGGLGGMNQQQIGGYGGMNQHQMGGFGGMNQQSMGMGFSPGAGMRPGIGMGPGAGMSPGMGMNLNMGQGSSTMQHPTGLPQGSPYNGGYNPNLGGGFLSQQPYGGGY
ncbi:unnamed protein product [Rhodiola kirilowii]